MICYFFLLNGINFVKKKMKLRSNKSKKLYILNFSRKKRILKKKTFYENKKTHIKKSGLKSKIRIYYNIIKRFILFTQNL